MNILVKKLLNFKLIFRELWSEFHIPTVYEQILLLFFAHERYALWDIKYQKDEGLCGLAESMSQKCWLNGK